MPCLAAVPWHPLLPPLFEAPATRMDEAAPLIDLYCDDHFMREALRQARRAAAQDEVPIGAVIVHDRQIIARAWNQVETLKDATAHAEMLALTQAQSTFGDWRLTGCDLYVTKEPCPMCAGAIVHTRIRRVIFGCSDPKGGAAGGFWNLLQTDNLNHRCEVSPGILGSDCAAILKDFFARARRRKAGGLPHSKGLTGDPPLFDGP
jgi:tRNA(adenine34) deaminase